MNEGERARVQAESELTHAKLKNAQKTRRKRMLFLLSCRSFSMRSRHVQAITESIEKKARNQKKKKKENK